MVGKFLPGGRGTDDNVDLGFSHCSQNSSDHIDFDVEIQTNISSSKTIRFLLYQSRGKGAIP